MCSSDLPGPARPPGLRTFLLLLIVLAGPRAGAQTTVGAMTFASEGVTINTNQPGYAYLTNGTLTLTAIRQRDYTQLQANMLLFGTVVAMMSLLVDISYAWLDPRIRYS